MVILCVLCRNAGKCASDFALVRSQPHRVSCRYKRDTKRRICLRILLVIDKSTNWAKNVPEIIVMYRKIITSVWSCHIHSSLSIASGFSLSHLNGGESSAAYTNKKIQTTRRFCSLLLGVSLHINRYKRFEHVVFCFWEC